MRLRIQSLALGIGLISLWCGSDANASVSLSFTNGTGTPTAATVIRGTTFNFTVKLTSTTAAANDQVTAVDYYLAGSTSNVFTIAARNTTTDGSAFGFTYASDAGVAAAPANPALNISASPNFRNGTDLGGSQTNISDPPVSNTTVVVADYTLSVAANTTPGVYTLTTFSQAGTGYVDASTNLHTFASTGVYTVTVTTPEPSTLALLGLGVAGIALRRRRTA